MGLYQTTVLADGAVGYWQLGTDANDSVASPHHGVAHGGVTFGQTGPLSDGSGAALFNGTTGFVDVTHNSVFNGATLSVEVWVLIPSIVAAWRGILGKGPDNATVPVELFVSPSASKVITFYSQGSQHGLTTAANVVGAGWTHLVFTYDGTTGIVYMNGASSISSVFAGSLVTNTAAITIGEITSLFLAATLAHVAWYTTVLTPTQVAAHYAARTDTGVTYPKLERGIRGLNRGVCGGMN